MRKEVSKNQEHQKIVEHQACFTTNKKTPACISKKGDAPQPFKYDIELPQSIIDSFARFLVPEIRKYYESEQGQREFKEWEKTQNKK